MNSWFEFLGAVVVDSLLVGSILLLSALLGLAVLKNHSAKLRHNFVLIVLLALPISTLYSVNRHYQHSKGFSSYNAPVDLSIQNRSALDLPIESISSTFSESENFSIENPKPLAWLGLIWALGFGLFTLRYLLAISGLQLARSKKLDFIDAEIMSLFESLRVDFGISPMIKLYFSDKILSPQLVGFFKPIVLFPLGLIEGLSMEEVELILRHELAHVSRKDHVIHMVINVLKVFYFFNPAYWWLASQIDNEREFATDDLALHSTEKAITYAKALAHIEDYRQNQMVLGFAGNSKNQLLKRIQRMTQRTSKTNWLSGVFSLLIISSMFLLTSLREKAQEIPELPTEKPLTELDSLPVYIKAPYYIQADTDKVSIALKEILDGTVKIEMDGNYIKSIIRDGKKLEGKELETYKSAHNELQRYAEKVVYRDMNNQQKELLRKEAQLLQERLQRLKAEEDLMQSNMDSLRILEYEMALNLQKKQSEEYQAAYVEREKAIQEQREMLAIATEQKEKQMQLELKRQQYLMEIELLRQNTQMKLAKMRESNSDSDFTGIVEVTNINADHAIYSFGQSENKEENDWAKAYVQELIYERTNNPKLILDGKAISTKWKDIDNEFLNQISKIELYTSEEMKTKFKKREYKGFNGILVLSSR